MDLSRDRYHLLRNTTILEDASVEFVNTLQQGTSQQYLNTLAALALHPSHTSNIFTYHQPIFVEICGRWLDDPQYRLKPLATLAALARILSFAPNLAVYAEAICQRLPSLKITSIDNLAEDELGLLLLTFHRLLLFDNRTFASYILPATLQILLRHATRYIRYLAIRILCLYLYAADEAFIQMVKIYLGDDEVPGHWDGIAIDYTFLSLWERKRVNRLQVNLRESRDYNSREFATQGSELLLYVRDLSSFTACIGGILVPCMNRKPLDPSRLIVTPSVNRNLASFAVALNTDKHLLITGISGSGKSSLIKDVARTLGKLSSMITLHLNEQTDAKLLLGVYTTGSSPGSFAWRSGVLTTAVKEGRWVLIEDLDRAPNEVISILLPLLERGELQQYNGGETITAARGFRLIATIRTSTNSRGDEISPAGSIIGIRNWRQVSLQMPPENELSEIALRRHPMIHAVLPRMMEAYRLLTGHIPVGQRRVRATLNPARSHGPRDLFKWCQRTADLFMTSGFTSGNDPVHDAFNDSVFLNAVSCFAGDLPSVSQRSSTIRIIAQALHVPIERAEFCLNRRPEYSDGDSVLHIGRASLIKARRNAQKTQHRSDQAFALTTHVLCILESISIAIGMGEPCLLVGETGTGKTTMIQQLAKTLHRNLTIINLSQQSEAGDLLGGFKPINLRVLAVPMKEIFDELFEATFSSKRNQRFIDALGKSIAKGQWTRSLTLWQEALHMVDDIFNPDTEKVRNGAIEHPQKRRKVDNQKYQSLKVKWSEFASSVKIFQMHLQSGSKGFAFAFVESNIVKAARNGDWVLLDEINLASPDILESLAGLLANGFDEDASLVLTETGDAEKIYAHKDFRIFAAMNPATDIGKRDLPMGIRSRFTEIYVDTPDDNLKSLVEVVTAYFHNQNLVDVQLASDIAQLYFDIQKLAQQNRLVDGANQKPHFSLRTLTRTLVYAIDLEPLYGLRRALFEGFSMSFLTFLDKASESLLTPLIEKHILSSQKNAKGSLHQTPRRPPDNKSYVQFRHYWVAQGEYPVEEQPHYIITPFVERNLLNLIRATSTRRFPVLLQGPTSSGKTSMVEYLAHISGNKFIRINNHEHTDLQEYLGTYVSGPDGQLQYQEGVLVQALREGHWIVLDELNLAPTDVLEALNRLLDDNRELLIPETQQVVRPHYNFMLFATQNPPGMYGGRKVLSRAFRNRFLELHFDDIPEVELETILRERSQIAPSFCTKIVAVYKRLSMLRQAGRLFEQNNGFATLRDLFRWALRDADDREQLAINGFMLLAERIRNSEERLTVKRTIEDIMKVEIKEDRIYSTTTIPGLADLNGTSIAKGIVWTKSMRRLYVLVTEALKHNEPVLLVGETGCGKTSICQVVSEVLQRQLSTVNAHQNTETGDLIGAQRPVRNRIAIEEQLLKDLSMAVQATLGSIPRADQNLSSMLQAYNDLSNDERRVLPPGLRQRIVQGETRCKAVFEWSDGNLVYAMKTGHHFLLDEISLADDSVLERLNSVLERSRTLLLAEKGSNDSFVVAASGFQFLATMNPGGDYGKRELSPALRNRFTEIWVPQVMDTDEMTDIVVAILPPTLKRFALPMVMFAAWFNMTYRHTSALSSIRQLLAWISFMRIDQSLDPFVAFSQGAAMVFIDSLGANPAGKNSMADEPIAEQRRVSVAKLSELVNHDIASHYDQTPQLLIEDQLLTIGHFSMEKSHTAVEDALFSLDAPTTRSNAMKIVRALQIPKPILLEGSPGVGKTSLVTALAKAIGMPVTRINLSEQTDIMDLFGSDVPVDGAEAGQFAWRDAPFLRAMRNGEWVLLDEMNLASQSVLEGLNACLDHRGQVYISEIDQSFSKHSNFVCFAAQNPHLQGNGRKGLPASFVDRFTVVYADLLEAEDLLIISRQCFPAVEIEVVESLTKCVTALNQLIRRDRKFGLYGGPWEFNLRDILRWLHLLASDHPFAITTSPLDYQNVLFLQRLRNAEDISTASYLFQQHLPQADYKHSYYQNVSPSFFQVGLGLLARNQVSQKCRIQGLEKDVTNLPIMESILLCVQQVWPCLLVGHSGSGKTAIISQIARTVGADLVVVPINSETDTMDLVGGYEQLDVGRKVASFIGKLREFVLVQIIRLLVKSHMIPIALTDIHQHLQAASPNLYLMRDLLARLTADVSFLDLTEHLHECKEILKQSVNDNQARFEWIDGVLVKALEKGQWLVLDNANLCSSSVLDRLNSLLEPNGALTINEHRFPDGSARIVSPHPDFRLFLTMDPQHGELSRAMRNRSIELFVDFATPLEDPLLEAGSLCESRMFRFFNFQTMVWDKFEHNSLRDVAALCFDHLIFSDYKLIGRWYTQVEIGLLNVSSTNQSLILSAMNTHAKVLTSGSKIVQIAQDAFGVLCNEETLQSDFGGWQTIHPLNNHSLVPFVKKAVPSVDLFTLGTIFDLMVLLMDFRNRLNFVRSNCDTTLPSHMSRLERSMSSFRIPTFRRDSTQPLAGFFDNVLEWLEGLILESIQTQSRSEQVFLSDVQEILDYLRDLNDLARTRDFDEGIFQVYLGLGRSIVERNELEGRKSLVASFAYALDLFDASWKLSAGLSMERLWSTFKPPTAHSLRGLKYTIEVEQLAACFDVLKWRSSASIKELERIQHLMALCMESGHRNDIADETGLEDLRKALFDVERGLDPENPSVTPYFQDIFEGLCQYQACSNTIGIQKIDSALHLLAGRATKELILPERPQTAYGLLSYVQDITGIGRGIRGLSTLNSSVPISLFQKLANVSDVSLRSFKLLLAEIQILTQTTVKLSSAISNGYPNAMVGLLGHLLQCVYEAHHDLLEPGAYTACQTLLSILANPPGSGDVLPELLTMKTMQLKSRYQYYDQILQKYHNSALIQLYAASKGAIDKPARVASAWISFFIGSLLLYVPDRSFDPALKPVVLRDRHERRKGELVVKLKSLQLFDEIVGGGDTNLRSHMVEDRLKNIGGEPQVPAIPRPRVSELGQLQAEFTNILNAVIGRLPHVSGPKFLEEVDANPEEFGLLRLNIAQAIRRLQAGFHAYRDITQPAVGLLYGLDTGLAMALQVCVPQDKCARNIESICDLTPFAGMGMQKFYCLTLNDLTYRSTYAVDLRLAYLRTTALVNSISPNLTHRNLTVENQVLHSYYEDWKKQLSNDQQQGAMKSSLYTYRGDQAIEIDTEEEEFSEIFPDFKEPSQRSDTNQDWSSNPQKIAQKLADAHTALFRCGEDPSRQLLEILRYASKDIAAVSTSASNSSEYQVSNANLLPALFLSLDETSTHLLKIKSSEKTYNFYTDANLTETQKLVSFVLKVQTRFSDLRETWPEHVTLSDIIRICNEVLSFRHTEPIAKVITKTEQLHAHIHEWQVVASREHSASTLYDELTSLLVAWRRLELSTWARLLDMEDKKCVEDTKSWWFIAYEAIIASSLSVIHSGEDLQLHVEQLLATLEDFLLTTPVGQYVERLRLIDCFEEHLNLFAKNIPLINSVKVAIVNLQSFYRRFEKSVRRAISEGRQRLEKDLKEILLLASWKDTNINALRESAKRSHHKLFKVVRKYRALLSQPADLIVRKGLAEYDGSILSAIQRCDSCLALPVDIRALALCRDRVSTWASKPARFVDPEHTASSMDQYSSLPLNTLDIPIHVETFADNIVEVTKTLQKETPTVLTKENKSIVKHLKSRKRNAFSDTLKALRHMGFRSNPSADTLALQASLSQILSQIPVFQRLVSRPDLDAAQEYLHKFLERMPQARAFTRSHSEDLSNSDISRSIGYLESILAAIIRQRSEIARFESDTQSLNNSVNKMRTMWAPDVFTLRIAEANGDVAEIQMALQWLPTLLDIGSTIIQVYNALGHVNSPSIALDLARWRDEITSIIKTRAGLPDLPYGLSSSLHSAHYESSKSALVQLQSDLERWVKEVPEVDFVLKQIKLWIEPTTVSFENKLFTSSTVSVTQLDEQFSRILDSILVVIQRVHKTIKEFPCSDDSPVWLMNAERLHAKEVKLLRVDVICAALNESMSQISFLDNGGGDQLKIASAIFASALPIVQKYTDIVQRTLHRYARFHRSLCKMAFVLVQSLCQIASQGFCSPAEKSAAQEGKAEKLEEGTGLGEGEGAEDISKDVQDDEDLSELAQNGVKERDREDIEDEKDAVNMDHEELEGSMGDASDRGEDGDQDGSHSEGSGNDVDDETGEVDNLDPSAVDERLWDQSEREAEKDEVREQYKGKEAKDEQQAASEQQKNKSNPDTEVEDAESGDEGSEEDDEVTAQERSEKLESYPQEEQNLDLPEDINLQGEERSVSDSVADDHLDEVSDNGRESAEKMEGEAMDIDNERSDNESQDLADDSDIYDNIEEQENEENEVDGTGDAESPVDTDPEDNEASQVLSRLQDYDNGTEDKDNVVASGTQGLGEDTNELSDQHQKVESGGQGGKDIEGDTADRDQAETSTEDGQLSQSTDQPKTTGGPNDTQNTSESQAFKKLGDALEKWHRRRCEIRETSDVKDTRKRDQANVNGNQELEHLQDENAEADTQALGAVLEDQAPALDRRALDSEMLDQPHDFIPDDKEPENAQAENVPIDDADLQAIATDSHYQQPKTNTFVGDPSHPRQDHNHAESSLQENPDELDDLDTNLSTINLQHSQGPDPRYLDQARVLWHRLSSVTRPLSLSLTSSLRLILAPTHATKMRGDFRTGKRLNLKRIIPYIASSYKRDKIWMRRSVPTKRNYQIMLAVDDSKSMSESGAGETALMTLAMVTRSLNMLEVGEVAVVGFGDDVKLMHGFETRWDDDSGVDIFSQFTFQQLRTNVRKLLEESILLFREARLRATGAGAELWQLQVIISDGVCEDHESIRQLVRQAQEERIMIVFCIVERGGESIVDMQQAVFEEVDGETKLSVRRYLEGFPFRYYVVVGDVRELPDVLATALRGWFREVVESG